MLYTVFERNKSSAYHACDNTDCLKKTVHATCWIYFKCTFICSRFACNLCFITFLFIQLSSSSWASEDLRKYLLPHAFLLCCKLGIIFDSDIYPDLPRSAVSRDCWLFSCSTSKIGALFPYFKAWSNQPYSWFPDVVCSFSFILSFSEDYFLGPIPLLYHFVSAFRSWHWLPTFIRHKLLIFFFKFLHGLSTFHTTSLSL